ncbi:retrovirus-related pol polyprotein from transposon TNT 1-94 [Tanacetum coccineum]
MEAMEGNNREVHLDYLKNLKESVVTLREIVEEDRIEKPLYNALKNACFYTKRSQELLEYVIGTCLKEFNKRDKKAATTPLNRKKQVTFKEPCDTSNNNTQTHVEQQKVQNTNVHVIPSIGVNSSTEASGSKPRSNTKNNRILPAKSDNKKKVEAHPRNNKSKLKQENHVNSSISSKRTKPTGRKFTLGEQCPLTRKKAISTGIPTTAASQTIDVPVKYTTVVQIILWYLDSGCLKHMTGNRSRLKNFVKKFIEIVFRNDHFGAIMGYEDYVIDLEVAFRKHSCYVRDVDGVELLKGCRGLNLYTISVKDMMKSSPICLLSKASKNKSWLWHRQLNHLNFCTINDLARKYLVRGLPRLKFEKDHLCSDCQMRKSKKYTHKPKSENTIMEVLPTLYMDLCGPMRVQSINGKKYILVIVDDYSRFTWVKFLRSKDETSEFNDIVKRRNRTLIEAARTMLIFSKALMFLWAEAVATACYTKNRSLMHTRHNKTSYELVHDMKPDLKFLRVFGVLCYPTNDIKDLGKFIATVDIGIFVGYAPNRKGLVPNPVPAAPYVPPINKDLEILFQPMFDEYFEPPRVESPVPPAPPAVQVLIVLAGVTAGSLFEDNPFAHADNDPFVNVFAPEPSFEESSLGDVNTSDSSR